MLATLGVVAATALGAAGAAQPPAQPVVSDWFREVQTSNTLSFWFDERVFALFATFDAVGFAEGETRRTLPFPSFGYEAVRAQVRARVVAAPTAPSTTQPVADAAATRDEASAVRAAAEGILDKNQVPIDSYIRALIEPDATPIDGLDTLVDRAWKVWRLGELSLRAAHASRSTIVSLANPLDVALARLKSPLGLPESTQVQVLVVALDVPGVSRPLYATPTTAYVSTGPSRATSVVSLLTSVARLYVAPVVRKAMPGAPRAGVGDVKLEADLISEKISKALALKAAGAPQRTDERDVAELFAPNKPFERAVIEATDKLKARFSP